MSCSPEGRKKKKTTNNRLAKFPETTRCHQSWHGKPACHRQPEGDFSSVCARESDTGWEGDASFHTRDPLSQLQWRLWHLPAWKRPRRQLLVSHWGPAASEREDCEDAVVPRQNSLHPHNANISAPNQRDLCAFKHNAGAFFWLPLLWGITKLLKRLD